MKQVGVWIVFLALLLALGAGSFLSSPAFRRLEPEAQRAVALAARSREIAPRLARYPGWSAAAEREDGPLWHVEFQLGEEWLGEAYVDLEAREVREFNLPVEPTPAERARIVPRLRKRAAADPEVRALLGGLDWDEEITYDKWEDAWIVYYWRGEDGVGVRFGSDKGRLYVEGVFDPLALEAEQARRHAQDRAIQLAYQVEAVGRALEPYDSWQAYAEPVAKDLQRWTVTFATPDKTIVTVLVDTVSGRALRLETP